MPSVRFAINGLGRIGRALARIAAEREGLELVAVNDLAPADQLARLLAQDTLHRCYPGKVAAAGDRLEIDGREVAAFRHADPAEVPWSATGATIVVDATGMAKTRALAAAHLRGTIERVIVSANASGLDLTVCVGVNDGELDLERHRLLSAASCTTNCLVPVLAVLDESFGVRSALLDTVHSYNNDQSLLEAPHPDPRRARAATLNMIPTTTSAIEAATRILPNLAGKLGGLAVRVPTPNVSLIDRVVDLEGSPGISPIHAAFRRAEEGPLAGVLGTTERELVSFDFLGDPRSAIVDLPLTDRAGTLTRVIAWYDNEWGHASRLADLLEIAGGIR